MAFTLQAIVGSTTVTLNNGSPFKLVRASGMGGAPVRRVTAQGPSQHGDTDLGYRLQPRTIELVVGFHAATDALLDAHRDTLTSIFKPLSSTPVKLRVERDDGEVRQIDCYTVGTLDIALVPEYRPGHYHEATVRLRAADPAWYGVAPGTVTTTGTADMSQIWYYAGGAIGTAQLLDQGVTPAQGEAWAYTGTLGTSDSWTIAIRTGKVALGGDDKYPYHAGSVFWKTNATPLTGYAVYAPRSGDDEGFLFGDFMSAGTENYFHSSFLYQPGGGINFSLVQVGVAGARTTFFADPVVSISGTARRWRSNSTGSTASYWPEPIDLYAIYSPALSDAQITALNTSMNDVNSGSVVASLAIPYSGELPEYPIISVTGPVTGLKIANIITGDTLDFGTATVGAGTTYVIDTRYGHKTILAGTVNKRGELTASSDLAEWHLAPDPVAAGGVNPVTIYGTNPGTATRIEIIYYNRYSGF